MAESVKRPCSTCQEGLGLRLRLLVEATRGVCSYASRVPEATTSVDPNPNPSLRVRYYVMPATRLSMVLGNKENSLSRLGLGLVSFCLLQGLLMACSFRQ